jgi:uncharacterized protein
MVPRANIGAMRLPADTDEAVALIRHAIDHGMTYIDTSRGYGDSEIKLGKALKDGYREKVILSTKWAPWVVKYDDSDDASADCTRRRMEESMRRLDVDRLDFYQIWSTQCREHFEQAVARGGMLDGILKARDEGLVDHIGFTTHDSPENLLSYLPDIDWCEVVLFSFNLLNTTYGPVIEAYHEKGIGTIVMNPVGGGKLKEASTVLAGVSEQVGAVSVPDLAVRFLMSHPYIDTIIPGITQVSDVDDTIRSVDRGALGEAEMARVRGFLDDLARQQQEFCTACGYCAPCPQGINIPQVMSCIFEERFWGLHEIARQRYAQLEGPKAEACAHCGDCLDKCPQKLNIPDEMEYCRGLFG